MGYPSDLTDAEWALLEPLLGPHARPRKYALRDVVDAVLYQTRTGCQWRYLPGDLPPRSVVMSRYLDWMRSGLLERIHDTLRKQARTALGRPSPPTAGIVDSQTAKSSGAVQDVGYDGAKKMKGRKRHIVTDMLGLILALSVHSAAVQDRDGAREVVNAELARRYPTLQVVYSDSAYQGGFERSVNENLPFRLEVVHRNGDSTRGDWAKEGDTPVRSPEFKVVPKRWIVERTYGWLSRWRRLSRDYEVTTPSAHARVLWAAGARILALLGG